MIFVGSTIMAAGFVFFINPYNIVPGGLYGTSIVLHNLFPSIQIGTFGYMLEVPLLILSATLLGAKLGARTLFSALITPFIMNAITWLVFPDTAAVESLSPELLLGGSLNLSGDLLLTTIMGSVVIGVGEGLVIRQQATTGGSDIVAMIMQKYAHIKFSTAILLVDGAVVAFGLLVIGFGLGTDDGGSQKSCLLSLYSLIAIYVISRVIARVLNGAKNDKLIFIISEKKLPELRDFILNDLDRTATCVKSSGLYSQRENEMIFLVVSYKQVNRVKHSIKHFDPRAFVVVTDAYDTFGEGFKELPDKDDVNPE